MFYFFLLLAFCSCTISSFILNKVYIKTSTMAAVMTLGIITEGVVLNFFGPSFFYGVYGKLLSVLVIGLWISFSFSLILTFFHKKFINIHYIHPINRFGIGTWIAGTSICGTILYQQLIEWTFIAQFISYVNFGLWIIYISICIRGFYDIYHNQLSERIHGILLLTTVSTQSIVILLNTVYLGIPTTMNLFLLTLGLCFYFLSSFFILKRYSSRTVSWSMEADWNNTNCILHGALSITGLASIVSHAVSNQSVIILWIFAASAFFIVESLEVYRLLKRIKCYGLKQGIFIYDVTQWSRLFTFGMFYTFTFLIEPNSLLISLIQNMVMMIGIWIILILFLIECLLCLHFLLKTYRKSPAQL